MPGEVWTRIISERRAPLTGSIRLHPNQSKEYLEFPTSSPEKAVALRALRGESSFMQTPSRTNGREGKASVRGTPEDGFGASIPTLLPPLSSNKRANASAALAASLLSQHPLTVQHKPQSTFFTTEASVDDDLPPRPQTCPPGDYFAAYGGSENGDRSGIPGLYTGLVKTANPKTKRSKSFKKGINQRPPMQSRKERAKEQAEKEARGEGVTALPSEPSIDALAKTAGPPPPNSLTSQMISGRYALQMEDGAFPTVPSAAWEELNFSQSTGVTPVGPPRRAALRALSKDRPLCSVSAAKRHAARSHPVKCKALRAGAGNGRTHPVLSRRAPFHGNWLSQPATGCHALCRQPSARACALAISCGRYSDRAGGLKCAWDTWQIVEAARKRLSPQTLAQVGLSEGDVYRLYRALRVYSVGFHQVVSELCGKIKQKDIREAVQRDVWCFFQKLWDEALQVGFESELVTMMCERDEAVSRLDAAEASRQEAQDKQQETQAALDKVVTQTLDQAILGRVHAEVVANLKSDLEHEVKAHMHCKLRSEEETKSMSEVHKIEMDNYKERLANHVAELERIRVQNGRYKVDYSTLEKRAYRLKLANTRHETMNSTLHQQLKQEAANAELDRKRREEAEQKLADRAKQYDEMETALADTSRSNNYLKGDMAFKHEQLLAAWERIAQLQRKVDNFDIELQKEKDKTLLEHQNMLKEKTLNATFHVRLEAITNEMDERDTKIEAMTKLHAEEKAALEALCTAGDEKVGQLEVDISVARAQLARKRGKKKAYKEEKINLEALVEKLKTRLVEQGFKDKIFIQQKLARINELNEVVRVLSEERQVVKERMEEEAGRGKRESDELIHKLEHRKAMLLFKQSLQKMKVQRLTSKLADANMNAAKSEGDLKAELQKSQERLEAMQEAVKAQAREIANKESMLASVKAELEAYARIAREAEMKAEEDVRAMKMEMDSMQMHMADYERVRAELALVRESSMNFEVERAEFEAQAREMEESYKEEIEQLEKTIQELEDEAVKLGKEHAAEVTALKDLLGMQDEQIAQLAKIGDNVGSEKQQLYDEIGKLKQEVSGKQQALDSLQNSMDRMTATANTRKRYMMMLQAVVGDESEDVHNVISALPFPSRASIEVHNIVNAKYPLESEHTRPAEEAGEGDSPGKTARMRDRGPFSLRADVDASGVDAPTEDRACIEMDKTWTRNLRMLAQLKLMLEKFSVMFTNTQDQRDKVQDELNSFKASSSSTTADLVEVKEKQKKEISKYQFAMAIQGILRTVFVRRIADKDHAIAKMMEHVEATELKLIDRADQVERSLQKLGEKEDALCNLLVSLDVIAAPPTTDQVHAGVEDMHETCATMLASATGSSKQLLDTQQTKMAALQKRNNELLVERDTVKEKYDAAKREAELASEIAADDESKLRALLEFLETFGGEAGVKQLHEDVQLAKEREAALMAQVAKYEKLLEDTGSAKTLESAKLAQMQARRNLQRAASTFERARLVQSKEDAESQKQQQEDHAGELQIQVQEWMVKTADLKDCVADLEAQIAAMAAEHAEEQARLQQEVEMAQQMQRTAEAARQAAAESVEALTAQCSHYQK
ncbi:hypothetical protein CYMTET_34744, partial [Cymbomonas tetramitiformis]